MLATNALDQNIFSSFFVFDLKKGTIFDRFGTRIISLTDDFLLGFQRGLDEECGEAAPEILYQCGKTWGKRYGKRVDKDFQSRYNKEFMEYPLYFFQSFLQDSFRVHGWGLLRFDFQYDRNGIIVVYATKPIMAEVLRKNDFREPVEHLLAGALAGIFCYYSKEDLDCVQTECIGKGDEKSIFVISLSSRLEDTKKLVRQGVLRHEEILEKLVNTRCEP